MSLKKKIKAIIESKEINKSGRNDPEIKKKGNKENNIPIHNKRFFCRYIILINYILF